MTQFSKSSLNKSKTAQRLNALISDRDTIRKIIFLGVILFLAIIGLKRSGDTPSTLLTSTAGKIESQQPQQQQQQLQQQQQQQQRQGNIPESFDSKGDGYSNNGGNIDFAKLAWERNIFNDNPEDIVKEQSYPTSYVFDTTHEMFHHYVPRKSGGAIEDMLMCHAYAFLHNATYGGSCGYPEERVDMHKQLLEALGLEKKLPFLCPRDTVGNNVIEKDTGRHAVRRSVVPIEKCREHDTRIWTPEYIHYLRTLCTLPEKVQHSDDSPDYTIVVHIRRGEVTPCHVQKDGFDRYLPNLHYQMLIDKYLKLHPNAKVRIYSQKKSHEPLDEFIQKGYSVSIDDDLKEIWRDFVSADLVIMSRSDFSMIPGLVAQGTIVYTPFWHQPQKHWIKVDRETMDKTNAEIKRLKELCPKENPVGARTFNDRRRPGRGHH